MRDLAGSPTRKDSIIVGSIGGQSSPLQSIFSLLTLLPMKAATIGDGTRHATFNYF